MLDYNSAAIVATLASAIPLFVVVRVVYLAFVSKTRFVSTDCLIDTHDQPKNEDGEPIQLVLKYSYRVGNRTFSGRRYYFGSKNECNPELLIRYPAGSRQTVFYDPKYPSRSSLQVGFHPRLWFWIITAMVGSSILWIAIVVGLVSVWKLESGSDGL
ncbi:MAG: DUF3592 domain-containing protein [Pirellula sp.]|jgi:hypothetical protein|nr:DUF3592 domain-containing protein [Pirellula sp.]